MEETEVKPRKSTYRSKFLLSLYCLIILILQHLKLLYKYLFFNFKFYCNVTFNFRIMKLKHLPNVIERYVHLRFIKGNKNEIFLKNINMPCPRFYSPMSLLLYSKRRNQHTICRVAYFIWGSIFQIFSP